MKIAVTGHTSGIGASIAEWFRDRGFDVSGFSRSNGYDLASPQAVGRIVAEAAGADVFVNNAIHEFSQTSLLYGFYDAWKDDRTKTIINIGSNAGDGVRTRRHPYAVHKLALDHAAEQLCAAGPKCRIMTIRPGWIDTPRVASIQAVKMSPDYVAEVVGWMYEQRHLVRTLTLNPKE